VSESQPSVAPSSISCRMTLDGNPCLRGAL
jgi:hypothetical protein